MVAFHACFSVHGSLLAFRHSGPDERAWSDHYQICVLIHSKSSSKTPRGSSPLHRGGRDLYGYSREHLKGPNAWQRQILKLRRTRDSHEIRKEREKRTPGRTDHWKARKASLKDFKEALGSERGLMAQAKSIFMGIVVRNRWPQHYKAFEQPWCSPLFWDILPSCGKPSLRVNPCNVSLSFCYIVPIPCYTILYLRHQSLAIVAYIYWKLIEYRAPNDW